jgi:hypothetical protein
MAIQLTTINGTDSIAATRITINDNFSTLSDALNSVLQMVNISTGYFDNSTFGSNPQIKTGSVVSTNTITSTNGDIIASQGNLKLGINAYIEFGTGSGTSIQRFAKPLGGGSNIAILSIASALTGTTSGICGGVVLPRQTTAIIRSIQNPDLGTLVYDISQNVIAYCVGTTNAAGATGTWYKISATGATTL